MTSLSSIDDALLSIDQAALSKTFKCLFINPQAVISAPIVSLVVLFHSHL